jgi:uncharacterized protein
MKNWIRYIEKLLIEGFVFVVTVYQKILSPDHGIFSVFIVRENRCRFYPSCSAYSIQAVRQYGLFRGIMASLKRIMGCNPWGAGGYAPLKNPKF